MSTVSLADPLLLACTAPLNLQSEALTKIVRSYKDCDDLVTCADKHALCRLLHAHFKAAKICVPVSVS